MKPIYKARLRPVITVRWVNENLEMNIPKREKSFTEISISDIKKSELLSQ